MSLSAWIHAAPLAWVYVRVPPCWLPTNDVQTPVWYAAQGVTSKVQAPLPIWQIAFAQSAQNSVMFWSGGEDVVRLHEGTAIETSPAAMHAESRIRILHKYHGPRPRAERDVEGRAAAAPLEPTLNVAGSCETARRRGCRRR